MDHKNIGKEIIQKVGIDAYNLHNAIYINSNENSQLALNIKDLAAIAGIGVHKTRSLLKQLKTANLVHIIKLNNGKTNKTVLTLTSYKAPSKFGTGVVSPLQNCNGVEAFPSIDKTDKQIVIEYIANNYESCNRLPKGYDIGMVKSKAIDFVDSCDLATITEYANNDYLKKNNSSLPYYALLGDFQNFCNPKTNYVNGIKDKVLQVQDYASCRFSKDMHSKDFNKVLWEIIKAGATVKDLIFFIDASKDFARTNGGVYRNDWIKKPSLLLDDKLSLYIKDIKKRYPEYEGKNLQYNEGTKNQYRPRKLQVA